MTVTEYRVAANLDKSLSAAVVADIHDKPYKWVMDKIKEREVDLIFIPGDIVYLHGERAPRGFDLLRECAAVAPTFMSLGNHENGALKNVRRVCEECGVELLESRSVEFMGLNIGGITSGYIGKKRSIKERHWSPTPPPDLEWLSRFEQEDGFKVLLNHHPEYYPTYIKQLNIDLTISGHAHGGQWRIFGRGVFAPGQGLFPKYTSGFHDGRLIISRGLANNAPAPRFFNPRELVFINFLGK